MNTSSPQSQTGTLYGIGVGPGDPELITLKALRILQNISVVAFPAPKDGHSLTYSIAKNHIKPQTQKIFLRMPINPGTPNPNIYLSWQKQISPFLDKGQNVAVLCEGDPMLYGSFQYIMTLMISLYPVVVIPGISSVSAASASLLFPLCSYHQHFHIISATDSPQNINHILSLPHPCAILKVGKRLPSFLEIIRSHNKLNLAFVASYASFPQQSLTPLSDFSPSDTLPYFSLILIKAPS
jgi:precorrin-2/cobalt-factor-2 C20-methyltransferase